MSTTSTGSGLETPRRRRRRLIGELLADQGVVSATQLAAATAALKTAAGKRLGQMIVELGYATEAQVCEALAEQLQIPAADLVAVDVPSAVLDLIPKGLALQHMCLPWFVEGHDLYLIMADPTNVLAADAVGFATGLRVKPVVAPETEVIAALARFYAAEESSLAQFENIDLAAQLSVVSEEDRATPYEDDAAVLAQGAPVVKLVNAILADAIAARASDIHIEPQERDLQLRYRVDGLLRQVMTMPKRVQTKVVSRVKIMAHMDISEHRKPQDGRTRIVVGTKAYDLRVSTLPIADGEKVVIRVLLQDRARVALEDLGIADDTVVQLREMLRRPQGMILVTGPTGSGKTSTLYAALNFIKAQTINIVTIEDPVEYRLAGVNQVPVSEKTGLTFVAGLRSVLRQDPDVVMVGEIRDVETASIAFQAAQTGHMVLSTLHTNDAPSAVTRLVEMGVPAYLVASSCIAVLAQRLVRRLCSCKTVNADGTSSAKGCEACHYAGFSGRMAIYELMRLTPRVRSVVIARGSDDAVRAAARASGMRTMFEDGCLKVRQGTTVLDEVVRVAPPDEREEVTPEERQALPEALSSAAGVARRPRVLIADDDDDFRQLLAEILEAEQYETIQAESGDAALALVYRESPDLVLTDLTMPRMDGLELLKRLRSNLATCQIPVVFITVTDSHVTEAQALDLGADDYVAKPVERLRLLSRVRRALFRAHLHKSGT